MSEKTLGDIHKITAETQEDGAECHGGMYYLVCACGWKSERTYGGNYPDENEGVREQLERIGHLITMLPAFVQRSR